jgi:acetyl esterase
MSPERDGNGDGARFGPVVTLAPAAQRLVDAQASPPYLHDVGPVDGRTALLESQAYSIEDAAVSAEYRVAPVGPSGLVGFWIFRPAHLRGPLPVVVYGHGGRWMLGDAQTHARLIRQLALQSGAAFVVPEYTRTPEARYPVAIEEIYALLTWLGPNAAELGLIATRLAVAGDCAGATMATALTLMSKQRSGPRICAQLLFYPVLDPACASVSHRQFAEGYLLTRQAVAWYWQQYGDDDELSEPTAAPARATPEDLAGLPQALIITAEADVVRDEGEQYARQLQAAGVAATAVRYLGTVHDFVSLRQLEDMQPTRAAVQQAGSFLHTALNGRR